MEHNRPEAGGSPISAKFTKFCRGVNVYKPGRGFYSLRHTAATVGGEAGDREAIEYILGHSPQASDMAAVYRERMAPERLFKVVKHIRKWLGIAKKPAKSESQPAAKKPAKSEAQLAAKKPGSPRLAIGPPSKSPRSPPSNPSLPAVATCHKPRRKRSGVVMDQEREDEILLNVALGVDPVTAVVAAADDRPRGPQKTFRLPLFRSLAACGRYRRPAHVPRLLASLTQSRRPSTSKPLAARWLSPEGKPARYVVPERIAFRRPQGGTAGLAKASRLLPANFDLANVAPSALVDNHRCSSKLPTDRR